MRRIVLDPFCLRQFKDTITISSLGAHTTPEALEEHVNREFEARGGDSALIHGYAPFCKHLFIPNYTGAAPAMHPITESTQALLESGYESRTPQELPVLSRWFPRASLTLSPAKFLDIILYSGEQLEKEASAMGRDRGSTAPWGIVSIKPQDVDYELPMQPITIMRNALGKEEGGSGVPLDREKYQESVEFWSRHATISED